MRSLNAVCEFAICLNDHVENKSGAVGFDVIANLVVDSILSLIHYRRTSLFYFRTLVDQRFNHFQTGFAMAAVPLQSDLP